MYIYFHFGLNTRDRVYFMVVSDSVLGKSQRCILQNCTFKRLQVTWHIYQEEFDTLWY